MTRADFTRTSVTDPRVKCQSNSIPAAFLFSAPKEVFTSKKFQSKGVPIQWSLFPSQVYRLVLRVIIRLYWGLCTHLLAFTLQLRKTSAKGGVKAKDLRTGLLGEHFGPKGLRIGNGEYFTLKNNIVP